MANKANAMTTLEVLPTDGAPATLHALLECKDEYDPELEAEDPYFNRTMQTDIRRAIAEMAAGKSVRFDPSTETAAEALARFNE
jgi:hypothetical protein